MPEDNNQQVEEIINLESVLDHTPNPDYYQYGGYCAGSHSGDEVVDILTDIINS